MKIIELDLRAFGPFKDHAVAFPEDKGLHILYGPNEAGKTAALNAIRCLFFRIPQNTCYDFRYAYDRLRIAATIKNGSDVTTFVRRKGRDASLWDGSDSEQLNESILNGMLNGLDEDRFRRMFGLNLEQLAEGAQQMLEGGGEIGATLFGAATGMPALIQARQQINADMESLFKPGGSKPELNHLLITYKNLGKEIKEKQLLPKVYEEKRKEHDALERAAHTLNVRQGELESDINHHQSLRKALQPVRERDELQAALQELGDVPLLDEAFSGKYHDLLQQMRQNERFADDAKEDLSNISEELESISVDETLLAQADRVAELDYSRKKTADNLHDRGELERDYHVIFRSLEDSLAALGEDTSSDDIESLRISSKEGNRITQLATDRDATKRQLESIREQLASTKQERDGLAKSIESATATEVPSSLFSAVSQARKRGDLEAEAEELKESIRELEDDARIALERLPFWEGTFEELERTPVPSPETCERFQNHFRESELMMDTAKAQIKEQRDAMRDTEQQLAQLEAGGAVPSLEDLAQARIIREAGWSLVREAWAEGKPPHATGDEGAEYADSAGASNLAEAYAKRVSEADGIADTLRESATAVHERAMHERNRESARGKIIELEQMLKTYVEQREQLEEEWREAWAEANIAPRAPASMREWLHQRDVVVNLAVKVREKRRQLAMVGERMSEHCGTIKGALKKIGEREDDLPEGFAPLLEYADRVMESMRASLSELQADRARLTEYDNKVLPQLLGNAERLKTTLEDLDTEWASAMASAGLDKDMSSAEAGDVLAQRQDLLEKHREAQALMDRIKQIDDADQRFRDDVAAFLKEFAPDLRDTPENEAVLELRRRVEEAKQNAQKREELSSQQVKLSERLQEAKRSVNAAQDELASLCKTANVETHESLPTAIKQSQTRQELEKRLKQLEEQINELAGAQSFGEFIVEVRGSDEAALNAKLNELELDLQATKQERDSTNIARGAINKEWQEYQRASNDAAELREKQELVASSISHLTEEYGQLEMARIVLDETIDRYRAQHEGPLLRRASTIFTLLTLGSFRELRVDFNDKGEQVLCAVRAEPAEDVYIDGLSEGTRDQLYLALRIAGLEDYVERHPMPVILDDILVNFDDDRAHAALEVFASLAQRTQVIYFTHHKHLVELAEQTVSSNVLSTQVLNGVMSDSP